jgi:inner membrane protein
MDNITHSLVGVVLSRTVVKENSRPEFERAALWAAVLGSNLPDLDFLLRPFVGGGNLGYLLHHRGYTHTVLASIPLGILAGFFGIKIAGLKKLNHFSLYALGVISVLFHMLADYCNNYGVHPFSPILQKWFYGDFIFIVEPLILFALIPYAFFKIQSSVSKALLLLIGLGLSVLVWMGPFVSKSVAVWISIWAVISFLIQKKFRSVAVPIAALVCILSLFWIGSTEVKKQVSSLWDDHAGHSTIQQFATTPAPSNPFCWSIQVLSFENADYVARVGYFSFVPHLFSPETCYFQGRMKNLTPLKPVQSLSPLKGLHWVGEYRRPHQDFFELSKKYCQFRAFIRFSRIPVWYSYKQQLYVEDLRYDQGGMNSFARFRLGDDQECLNHIPEWSPPAAQD